MQVKITRAKYDVRWQHSVCRPNFKVGEDETLNRVSQVEGTRCVIRGKTRQGRGETLVHRKDTFDVETGRKISLARALKAIGATKKVRTLFWKKYFGR